MTDPMTEAVARALAACAGPDYDWEDFIPDAQAAIAAMREQLVPQWQPIETAPEIGKIAAMYDPVINKCSELFGVHRGDILSVYRHGFLMPARFALCKTLHLCGLSYRHIGRIVNKDRSTVKSAVHRADYMMERDPAYAAKVDQLAHIVRALTAVKELTDE